MSERRYSFEEINRMRTALNYLLMAPFGIDNKAQVEDQLRTYMINGTDPEELEQQAAKWRAQWLPATN